MERQLGDQVHDDSAAERERDVLVPVVRLQGGARIHRRLHFHVDALQGQQPDAGRGAVPQADRRLGVSERRNAGQRAFRPRGDRTCNRTPARSVLLAVNSRRCLFPSPFSAPAGYTNAGELGYI